MDIVTDVAHAWLDTFSNVYSMYGHVAMMRFPFAYYICLGAFLYFLDFNRVLGLNF